MQSRVKDSKAKVRNLKLSRQNKTKEFRSQVSQNIFKRKMRKILEACKAERVAKRKQHDKKIMGLKLKYGRHKDEYKLASEISEYGMCEIFKDAPDMKPEDPSGPVVVCGEGEDLRMSSEEWQLLARGPKYCVVRGCGEEDMKVEIETAILKHKWDSMGDDDDSNDDECTEEERKENERVAQLAEEMGAQSRMAYNSEEDTWDARGLRVTDYRHNSRVIFPKLNQVVRRTT